MWISGSSIFDSSRQSVKHCIDDVEVILRTTKINKFKSYNRTLTCVATITPIVNFRLILSWNQWCFWNWWHWVRAVIGGNHFGTPIGHSRRTWQNGKFIRLVLFTWLKQIDVVRNIQKLQCIRWFCRARLKWVLVSRTLPCKCRNKPDPGSNWAHVWEVVITRSIQQHIVRYCIPFRVNKPTLSIQNFFTFWSWTSV